MIMKSQNNHAPLICLLALLVGLVIGWTSHRREPGIVVNIPPIETYVKQDKPPCYARLSVKWNGNTNESTRRGYNQKDFRIYGEDCWHGSQTYQGGRGDSVESVTLRVEPWVMKDENP